MPDRRIKDKDIAGKAKLAWVEERGKVKIHWSFTVDKARTTLKLSTKKKSIQTIKKPLILI